MRLDKYLCSLNIGSRKDVKDIIRKGKIKVNGNIVKDPSIHVSENEDKVVYEGNILSYTKYKYYMLHKPMGVVSATKDPHYPCVTTIFKNEPIKNLFPVGRLDIDTEGLLIITNDGEFAHRITSPTKHVYKTYFAKLDGPIQEILIPIFLEGFSIGEEARTMPAKLKILNSSNLSSEVEVSICEGRYHQVKRMFQANGRNVTYLKRVSIGSLDLDPVLQKGDYRELTTSEMDLIFTNKEEIITEK